MSTYIFLKNEFEKDEDIQGSYMINDLEIKSKSNDFSLDICYLNSTTVGSYMTDGHLAVSVKGDPVYTIKIGDETTSIEYGEEKVSNQYIKKLLEVIDKIKKADPSNLTVISSFSGLLNGWDVEELEEEDYKIVLKEVPQKTTGSIRVPIYLSGCNDPEITVDENIEIDNLDLDLWVG